jgi:hypothetical protein
MPAITFAPIPTYDTCYYFILDQSPVATGSLGECQKGWTEKGLSPFSRIENGAVGKFKIII